jgi:HK97 family phage major capsid protein
MTAASNDHFDQTVIRDFTVSRQMLDALRGVLPPCHVCGRPSGYRDFEGRWSHQICAGESSKEKRDAKLAARFGKVAPDAGQHDLNDLVVIVRKAEESALAERGAERKTERADVVREAEQHSEGPRAVVDQAQHVTRRDGSVIKRGDSAALVQRMTERQIYDLDEISHMRVGPFGSPHRQLIERAERAVDLGRFPGDQARVKEHITGLLHRGNDENFQADQVARHILLYGSPAYRSAFLKAIRSTYGMYDVILTPEENKTMRAIASFRAMNITTSSAGGFLVPPFVDPTLISPTGAGSSNPFRAVCRVEQITVNEWRGLISTGLTLAYVAEAAASADTSPTLGQPTIPTFRAQGFIPASYELWADWDNALDQLSALFLDARNDLEATKFVSGTGTLEPTGVLVGVATANAGVAAVAPADLYTLELALPTRFRRNAVIFANKAILDDVLKDANTGASIWLPNLSGKPDPGSGYTLIGYPFGEASGMTSSLVAASKIAVIFDPRYFVIVERVGMEIEVIPSISDSATGYPKGQRGIWCMIRNGAKLLDVAAARVLVTT